MLKQHKQLVTGILLESVNDNKLKQLVDLL